jgi:hypothetical protein
MGAERNSNMSEEIDLTAVVRLADEIAEDRATKRRKAKTTRLAHVLADTRELLNQDLNHPRAATAAALLSGDASAEDMVTALRALYGDAAVNAAFSSRPANVIPGTAQRRIPIIEADGHEHGSVPEDDHDAKIEIEGRGYRLTRLDDNRVVYKKDPTPADTRVQRPPATPLPSGQIPLFDKKGTSRVGWVSPEDGARRAREGDLVAIKNGDEVVGYRLTKFWEH